ncbi:hypothetical protein C6497_06055 [Candidatus Poribacteria bacterium]|nr:MAG: hypothetical protein C6497_06055 [Candidatus Poribacteria bacterium]
MIFKTQKYLIITTLLLFCIIGCTRESVEYLSDSGFSSMDEHVPDPKMTFEQNVQPILTEKCALSGCHVDGGKDAHGVDLTSYETFIAGGDHGPIFVPGNADASEIVEEIVSGNMPKGGDQLPYMEIRTIKDWINMQPSQDTNVTHDDHHDDEEDHGGNKEDEHDADDHDDNKDQAEHDE